MVICVIMDDVYLYRPARLLLDGSIISSPNNHSFICSVHPLVLLALTIFMNIINISPSWPALVFLAEGL